MATGQATTLERPRPVTAAEVASYKQNGWVKLDRLISPEGAGELRDRLGRMMAKATERLPDQALYKVLSQPSHEDGEIGELVHSMEMGRVASDLIGCGRPGVQAVRLWSDNALVKAPASDRGTRTPWHQDQPYSPFDRQGGLTVWIALNEVPPEKGSLRFYSGSHRLGCIGLHELNPDGADALDEYPWIEDEFELSPALHLQPGDATVHNRALLHAAPENSTDEPRWAFTVTFIPAETRYTGAPHKQTDGIGLEVGKPFDHPRFPIVYP
jgi:hypothetical protein